MMGDTWRGGGDRGKKIGGRNFSLSLSRALSTSYIYIYISFFVPMFLYPAKSLCLSVSPAMRMTFLSATSSCSTPIGMVYSRRSRRLGARTISSSYWMLLCHDWLDLTVTTLLGLWAIGEVYAATLHRRRHTVMRESSSLSCYLLQSKHC